MSITQLCHMDESEDANAKLKSVESDAVPSKCHNMLKRTHSHVLFR